MNKISLAQRKKMAKRAIEDGKKLAIYLVENDKATQFRYRVYNVVRATSDGKAWQAVYFFNDELATASEFSELASLVVIERQAAKGRKVLRFIDNVKRYGGRVVLDIDDLVFDYRKLGLLMRATNNFNMVYWLMYVRGVRKIALKVDGFIATNDFLGQKLEACFKKPYAVIRNSLNQEQVEVSKKFLGDKHREFTIGYFSGSPTHTRDFKMVEPELLKFLREHDDARVEVVGYMQISGEAIKMIEEGRIGIFRPVDYLKLQELIARVNVSIAPLVLNDFTNCKSELKFFEAAVAETAVIASPNYSYNQAMKNKEIGYLRKPGEWYKTLEWIYKNPKENKIVAKAARVYALKHYIGPEFLKEIEDAYEYFAG